VRLSISRMTDFPSHTSMNRHALPAPLLRR